MNRFNQLLALIAATAMSLTGLAQAAENSESWAGMSAAKIAEVASVEGRVAATDGAGRARDLRIGDPIYAGERVSTASNSSAGLWLDETLGQPEGSLAQFESNSRARLTRATEGGARVQLEKGAVRIVDPREDGAGPAIELAALDSETRFTGGDREARILKEKTGPYAVMCDWAKPMTVVRGDQTRSAGPGGCVVGNNREPLFAAPAHGERIPLLAGAPAVAAAGPSIEPSSLLDDPTSLPPVSSPGPGGPLTGAPPVLGLAALDRFPVCGSSGSPCGSTGGPAGPPVPPVVVLQQAPTITPAPGI